MKDAVRREFRRIVLEQLREMTGSEEQHFLVRRNAKHHPTHGLVKRLIGLGVHTIGDMIYW